MIFSLTITINRSLYGSVIKILLWNEGYCMLLDFLAINNLTPVVDMTEKYQKENIFIIIQINCRKNSGVPPGARLTAAAAG